MLPGESPTSLGPVADPTATSTDARTVPPPAQTVRLVSASVSVVNGHDTITLTTAGGIPGWTLQYVDVVRINDEPFLTGGSASMELVLDAADPSGDQGAADDVAVHLTPDGDIVKSLDYVYYLGDQVTYAIGVDRVVPFTVSTTANTLVITFFG